jgi:TIR domain
VARSWSPAPPGRRSLRHRLSALFNNDIGYQPRFEGLFRRAYDLEYCDLRPYFDTVQIQQVPDFAYGENLAVPEEGGADRFSIVNSYEIFADHLINSARPWEADAARFYSCFLSYSAKDSDFAEQLYSDLQNRGIRCWSAPHLTSGSMLTDEMWSSIRSYEKVILIVSRNSVESPRVELEVNAALERERQQNELVLCPIRLDESVLKIDKRWATDIRRLRHIIDFSNWEGTCPWRILNCVEIQGVFTAVKIWHA